MMLNINDIIDRVIYTDMRFAIVSVKEQPIIISGNFSGAICPGMPLSANVEEYNHAVYGEQYKLVRRRRVEESWRKKAAVWTYLAQECYPSISIKEATKLIHDYDDPLDAILHYKALPDIEETERLQLVVELSCVISLCEMGMDWVIPSAVALYGASAPTQILSAPGVLFSCDCEYRDVEQVAMRLGDPGYLDETAGIGIAEHLIDVGMLGATETMLADQISQITGNVEAPKGLSRHIAPSQDDVFVTMKVARTLKMIEGSFIPKKKERMYWPGDIDSVAMEDARNILNAINMTNFCVVDVGKRDDIQFVKAISSFFESHHISWRVVDADDTCISASPRVTIITNAHRIPIDRLITYISDRTILIGDSLLSYPGDPGFSALFYGVPEDLQIFTGRHPDTRLDDVKVQVEWKKGAPIIRIKGGRGQHGKCYIGADYDALRIGQQLDETMRKNIPARFVYDTRSIGFNHLVGMNLKEANLGFRPRDRLALYRVASAVDNLHVKQADILTSMMVDFVLPSANIMDIRGTR